MLRCFRDDGAHAKVFSLWLSHGVFWVVQLGVATTVKPITGAVSALWKHFFNLTHVRGVLGPDLFSETATQSSHHPKRRHDDSAVVLRSVHPMAFYAGCAASIGACPLLSTLWHIGLL